MFIWKYVYLYTGLYVHGYVCVYTYGYILVFFFDLFTFMFFFSFTLFSNFCSDLREHNGNKAFLPILCYLSHCWCYSYLSAAIFHLQLSYFNQFVCLFFVFLRLIFRFSKFVSFIQFPLVCIYGKIKLPYFNRGTICC